MRRYLALARVPGGSRLLIGWLLVAPGQAAVDLVILLALHHATGSFGPGGIAVAAATIGFSVSAVVQGRRIDQVGIRRVLGLAALAVAATTAALAVAIALRAAPPALVVLSAMLGLSQPAASPAVRTAWTAAAPDPATLTAAFSYTSASQDAGFIAGPALFGLIATAATPQVALVCCGALTATGALAIAGRGAPSPPSRRAPAGRRREVLGLMAPLVATMTAVGAALGAVDVSAPAFATQHGRPGLGGLLLGACALGSLLGGLAYGARSWASPATRRLVACSVALAVLAGLPALASNPAAAAACLLIAGLPMGATLTTAYLIGGDRAPQDSTTGGFSLLTLAVNAGAAAGYALAAQLAAHTSASDGFLLGSGAGVLAALGAANVARAPRV